MNKNIQQIAARYFTDLAAEGRRDTPENRVAWLWFTCPAHLRVEVSEALNQGIAQTNPGDQP